MIQLHVVPKDLHDRILASDADIYRSLNDIDQFASALPINDLVDVCTAQARFPFDYEPVLGITMGETPLELLLGKDPGLNLTERLASLVEVEKLKETEDYISVYSLYPVMVDRWVAVEQRVHREKRHPLHETIERNGDFFDRLIGLTVVEVPFDKVAATGLFRNYLTALRTA